MLENSNPRAWEPGTQTYASMHPAIQTASKRAQSQVWTSECKRFIHRCDFPCHVFNLLPKGSVFPLSLIFVHKQLHNICIQQYISSYINNVSDESLQFLVGHGDYAYQQSSYTEQSYDRSFDDSTQHYYEGGKKIYWQSL